MPQEHVLAASRLKTPGGPGGRVPRQAVARSKAIGVQHFRRVEAHQLGAHRRQDVFIIQLCGGKFSGGDIHISNSDPPGGILQRAG